jgi:hypothetical protein
MQNQNPGGVTEAVASSLPSEMPIVFDLVSLKKRQELFFECDGFCRPLPGLSLPALSAR